MSWAAVFAPVVSMTGAAAYEVLGALLNTRATAAAPTASGFNAAYSDAGLVGVTGTCSNGDATALTHALASCFAVGLLGSAMFLVTPCCRFWSFLGVFLRFWFLFQRSMEFWLCQTVSVRIVCHYGCCCYCRSPPDVWYRVLEIVCVELFV